MDTPLGCIYLITCLVTGLQYVGQTIHPIIEDRFDEHVYAALVRKTRTYLYNAIRKYGPDLFSVELLCAVPYDALNRAEAYFAEQFQTYVWDSPGGYNMVWCGDERRRGIKHTKEAIDKMKENWMKNRERYLEQIRDPVRRYNFGSLNRGRHLSPDECKKLSDACKAWWTPERRRKWGDTVKGFMTEEVRKRISVSCRDWWTEENRLKKSEAMKASVTDADRERSSQASLAFWSNPENAKKMSLQRIGVKKGPMTSQAKANMSAAAVGKPKTQALKDSLKATAARKFAELFHKHLADWIVSPAEQRQWRYDITRKRRDGNLLEEYISILEGTPGWTWS